MSTIYGIDSTRVGLVEGSSIQLYHMTIQELVCKLKDFFDSCSRDLDMPIAQFETACLFAHGLK